MRASFRLKLALLTATVSAVPLVAVGWLLIDVNEREVESSSQALQIALVEQVASRVEERIERGRRTLGAIAATLSDDELDEAARLTVALRLLDADGELDVVGVYDAEGALIDRMRDPRAADVETPERLSPSSRADSGGGPPVERGDEVRILITAPIVTDDDVVTGYVATPLSLAPIQHLVERLSQAQLASREGAVMVIDGRRVLAHPDGTRLLEPHDVDLEAGSLARAPRSAEHADEERRTWVTTTVGLTDPPWAVVARMPRDVVYAPLDEMRRIVIATIAATLALAILAAFLLARRLAAPIARLVAFTKDLAARRFDRRVHVRTGDELALLGDALSDAAAELERSEEKVRREEAIRADLGRYLPAELVEQIIRREQSMELGGQRRPITVLFADVVAFTPLSDRLPPEQVVALLNELFTLLTEAVFRHGGTVDKFVGDCVMALFGAPAAQPDHAERALRAAQDMLRFLESANVAWKERFGVEVQLAIGVNTGDAVVGNVGSESRMEYTAIGDVVNVAARLETIARPQQILVTRATADAAGDGFDAKDVGAREVPGRAAPVELFEVGW